MVNTETYGTVLVEFPILSRKWGTCVNFHIKSVCGPYTMTLLQKIIFRMYWILLHLNRKKSKTSSCYRCIKDNTSLKHMILQSPILTKYCEKVMD